MNHYQISDMHVFYLIPSDLGDEPQFYKCKFIRECMVPQINRRIWIVKIEPNLPDRFVKYVSVYENSLLGLGIINGELNFEDIGSFGFVVDVLVVKDGDKIRDHMDISDFSRFGTGVISDTARIPEN